jgi:hypothetical protein
MSTKNPTPKSLTERLIELRVSRMEVGAAARRDDPFVKLLLVLADEMILRIKDQIEYADQASR